MIKYCLFVYYIFYRYVTENNSFGDVLEKMADGCIHRVFVCSEASVREQNPIPVNVITQSDMLKQVLEWFAFPANTWDKALNKRG